jgi:hypothetical protein
MAAITKIEITATDNELYLIATPSAGFGSSEIVHITSGNSNPVEYAVVPQSILPKGDYTLDMIGINWGGPSGFTVKTTGPNGVVTAHTAPPNPNNTVGVVWTLPVPMTV